MGNRVFLCIVEKFLIVSPYRVLGILGIYMVLLDITRNFCDSFVYYRVFLWYYRVFLWNYRVFGVFFIIWYNWIFF